VILLDGDSDDGSASLDGQFHNSSSVVVRPSIRSLNDTTPMDKDEDREVVFVRFRTEDVEVQALGNRELEFIMRQRLLKVAVFQLTCFCRLKTTWSISPSALHGMLTLEHVCIM